MAPTKPTNPAGPKPPSKPGTFAGEVKEVFWYDPLNRNKRGNPKRTRELFRWDGRAWTVTTGEEKIQANNDREQQIEQQAQQRYDARVAAAATVPTPNNYISQVLKTLPAPSTSLTSDGVLRYPESAVGGGNIAEDSDYVLFEFFKYSPPFKAQRGNSNFEGETKPSSSVKPKRGSGARNGRSTPARERGRTNALAFAENYFDYNQTYESLSEGKYRPIIMYMPEDIGTGFKANWGGKAFSNIGTGILKAAGAEGLSKLDNLATGAAEAAERIGPIAGAQAIRKAVQKITGDAISNDDVFGGISGAILNPNTELLFSGHDMRNFQLNFKMVPRNEPEAGIVNEIIKIFKMCTLPSRYPGKSVMGVKSDKNQGVRVGFIGVPNVVRVSFMKGPVVHPVLPVYKMCAITSVDVNYTPDGTYATYTGGQPVAISLSINFQETKLVFEEELENNSIR